MSYDAFWIHCNWRIFPLHINKSSSTWRHLARLWALLDYDLSSENEVILHKPINAAHVYDLLTVLYPSRDGILDYEKTMEDNARLILDWKRDNQEASGDVTMNGFQDSEDEDEFNEDLGDLVD